MREVQHLPALDGIRAMAILLVVASHTIPHTEGGGIGVQIFFTLSGFLITLLLLAEHTANDRVSYRAFYARRALRLYPALIVMVLLVAALPNVYGAAADSRLATIPVALVYLTNFANALGLHSGYTSHTWTLAIEEQFYLLWPVAAIWLATRGSFRQTITVLIPTFAVARLVMYAVGVPGVPDWLPAQADQLLMGALLAYTLQRGGGLPRWVQGAGAGMLALGVLLVLTLIGTANHQALEGSFGDLGGLFICGAATCLLIAHLVAAPNRHLSRLFAWGPAVAIGRVSYGIYLFHFPICQYVAHQHYAGLKPYAVEYTLTAAAVIASWFIIERPALRLKQRFSRRTRTAAVLPAPAGA